MTNEERLVLKMKCESNFLFFARYIYKEHHKRNFTVTALFILIAQTLEKVARREILRLIINMPPRYGKTELAVKLFICWCLAKWSNSKFIHLSYSDDLALDNSSNTKEYINSDAFQALWPMILKTDAQGKKKWFNTDGGGVYATAAGGPITGFGAGVSESEEFSGAIIIDDPLKPDDASSEVERNKVNNRYNRTIRSRTNDRDTPIIVIMQRLHEADLSGFLLDGGSGEKWDHLCLPALDENNTPLYPEKHTFEELEQLRQSDRYMFAGQYMQAPAPEEGGEWIKAWFNIVERADLDPGIKWNLYIDGAYTENTKNDPSGLMIAGKHKNDLYILTSVDKYLELPGMIKYIPEFLIAWGIEIGTVRIEPKASGKSTKQVLKDSTKLNVVEIKTPMVLMSKIERARTASPYIEGGRVHLVRGHWNDAFLAQVGMFPNAKHDEHVDLTSYAVENELILNQGTGQYSIG